MKSHSMSLFYMCCFLFTYLTNCCFHHIDCYVFLVTSFRWCWRLHLSCARNVNIYHTHTQCCKRCRASVVIVVQRSITTIAPVACTHRSITLSVCCLDSLRCLFVKSCWVCVRKFRHIRSHLFTHLVILLKLCRLNQPLTVKPPLSCIAQS